jgi:hypothetical protein
MTHASESDEGTHYKYPCAQKTPRIVAIYTHSAPDKS